MRPRKNQHGQVAVFYALLIPIFILFGGVGLDLGWYYLNVSRLQNAADAAVIVGAKTLLKEVKYGDTEETLEAKGYKVKLVEQYPADSLAKDASGNVVVIKKANEAVLAYVKKNLASESTAFETPNFFSVAEAAETQQATESTAGPPYTLTDGYSKSDAKKVTLTPTLYQSGDDYYYVVSMSEDVDHFFIGYLDAMNAGVVAVALISQNVSNGGDDPPVDPGPQESGELRIKFDANGGKFEGTNETEAYLDVKKPSRMADGESSEPISSPYGTPKMDDYEFKGWSLEQVDPGKTDTVTYIPSDIPLTKKEMERYFGDASNVTLYAVWEKIGATEEEQIKPVNTKTLWEQMQYLIAKNVYPYYWYSAKAKYGEDPINNRFNNVKVYYQGSNADIWHDEYQATRTHPAETETQFVVTGNKNDTFIVTNDPKDTFKPNTNSSDTSGTFKETGDPSDTFKETGDPSDTFRVTNNTSHTFVVTGNTSHTFKETGNTSDTFKPNKRLNDTSGTFKETGNTSDIFVETGDTSDTKVFVSGLSKNTYNYYLTTYGYYPHNGKQYDLHKEGNKYGYLTYGKYGRYGVYGQYGQYGQYGVYGQYGKYGKYGKYQTITIKEEWTETYTHEGYYEPQTDNNVQLNYYAETLDLGEKKIDGNDSSAHYYNRADIATSTHYFIDFWQANNNLQFQSTNSRGVTNASNVRDPIQEDKNGTRCKRIHSLFNMNVAYRVRKDSVTGKKIYGDDPLYCRIEAEPYKSETTPIRQIVININVSNLGDDYRPLFFFYDGPDARTSMSNNGLSSGHLTPGAAQPVILNLNADFKGVLFMPDIPVVINGNGHTFQGFIIAKEFRYLDTSNGTPVQYSTRGETDRNYASSKITVDANGDVYTTLATGNNAMSLWTNGKAEGKFDLSADSHFKKFSVASEVNFAYLYYDFINLELDMTPFYNTTTNEFVPMFYIDKDGKTQRVTQWKDSDGNIIVNLHSVVDGKNVPIPKKITDISKIKALVPNNSTIQKETDINHFRGIVLLDENNKPIPVYDETNNPVYFCKDYIDMRGTYDVLTLDKMDDTKETPDKTGMRSNKEFLLTTKDGNVSDTDAWL